MVYIYIPYKRTPTCVATCQERITNKAALDWLHGFLTKRNLCSRGTLLRCSEMASSNQLSFKPEQGFFEEEKR